MTPKQLQLLRFIKNKIVHTGNGPTFREMREHMGVTSNQTVADFLTVLEREGYLHVIQSQQRGIKVTQKAQEAKQLQNLEKAKTLPQTFTTFSSNTSSSFSGSQKVNGVSFQPTEVVPWKKGGEKNGTT